MFRNQNTNQSTTQNYQPVLTTNIPHHSVTFNPEATIRFVAPSKYSSPYILNPNNNAINQEEHTTLQELGIRKRRPMASSGAVNFINPYNTNANYLHLQRRIPLKNQHVRSNNGTNLLVPAYGNERNNEYYYNNNNIPPNEIFNMSMPNNKNTIRRKFNQMPMQPMRVVRNKKENSSSAKSNLMNSLKKMIGKGKKVKSKKSSSQYKNNNNNYYYNHNSKKKRQI